MNIHLLTALSLLIPSISACGSECICLDQDGKPACIAVIAYFGQHKCTGYCRDRLCGGTIPKGPNKGKKCRVWKGDCNNDHYRSLNLDLEYCDKKDTHYNDCPAEYDCPVLKKVE